MNTRVGESKAGFLPEQSNLCYYLLLTEVHILTQ